MTDTELLDGLDRLVRGNLDLISCGKSSSIRLQVTRRQTITKSGVVVAYDDYNAGTNPHAMTLRGAIDKALEKARRTQTHK